MKKVYRYTVMSWDNEEDVKTKKTIRAIALCDYRGYFDVAINAMRDGSMGEKDENGVYERKWWGDGISYGYDTNVRPADWIEVRRYFYYCPLKDQFSAYGLKVSKVVYGYDRTVVYMKPKLSLRWRRFVNWFKYRNAKLPF